LVIFIILYFFSGAILSTNYQIRNIGDITHDKYDSMPFLQAVATSIKQYYKYKNSTYETHEYIEISGWI